MKNKDNTHATCPLYPRCELLERSQVVGFLPSIAQYLTFFFFSTNGEILFMLLKKITTGDPVHSLNKIIYLIPVRTCILSL